VILFHNAHSQLVTDPGIQGDEQQNLWTLRQKPWMVLCEKLMNRLAYYLCACVHSAYDVDCVAVFTEYTLFVGCKMYLACRYYMYVHITLANIRGSKHAHAFLLTSQFYMYVHCTCIRCTYTNCLS
jgi:hypothetical protein